MVIVENITHRRWRRGITCGVVFCLLLLFSPASSRAQNPEPDPNKFSSPGYAGYSGLWDMPDARVLSDWRIRAGAGYAYPYYYIYTTLGLFDRVEINARISGIRDYEDIRLGSDYGDYKDKAIDIKFLLLKEGTYLPAVAIGATDIHGTGVFTSRYLTTSKRWGRWGFTMGLGQGLLSGLTHQERDQLGGNSDNRAFGYLTSDDDQFSLFGGVEYHVTPDLQLVAEYSSYKYENILGGEEAELPVNVGLKYHLWKGIHLQAGYAKGETLSAGLNVDWPLEAEGPLGWAKESPPVRMEKDVLQAMTADDDQLALILANSMRKDGFAKVKVIVAGANVWTEFENNRYNSPVLALRRAFRVLDTVAPPKINKMYLVLTSEEMFNSGLGAPREHLRNYLLTRIDHQLFLEFTELTHDRLRLWQSFARQSTPSKPASLEASNWNLDISPRFSTYLNDPSGVFKAKLAIDFSASARPWKGGLLTTNLNVPLFNNISTSNEIEEPEKYNTSDINYITRTSTHLTQYGVDQLFELPWGIRSHFGGGAYQAAWAGFGGEVFKLFGDGRFGIGLEGTMVWKRDPENDFKIWDEYDKPFHTYHLNLFSVPFPNTGVQAGMSIGRFLAEDVGVRFDLARTFEHFTIGIWYTVTDTSHFQSDTNRDYHDKGVYITFPLSIFDLKPVRGRYSQALQPWTRDPGQKVRQFRSLYPIGRELETPWEIKKNVNQLRW